MSSPLCTRGGALIVGRAMWCGGGGERKNRRSGGGSNVLTSMLSLSLFPRLWQRRARDDEAQDPRPRVYNRRKDIRHGQCAAGKVNLSARMGVVVALASAFPMQHKRAETVGAMPAVLRLLSRPARQSLPSSTTSASRRRRWWKRSASWASASSLRCASRCACLRRLPFALGVLGAPAAASPVAPTTVFPRILAYFRTLCAARSPPRAPLANPAAPISRHIYNCPSYRAVPRPRLYKRPS